MATTLSKQGIATLNFLEGCPLKAYRDVGGVWTIGAGLTAASGVIRPKFGMTITQTQADSLLQDALDKKYIPAVLKTMGASCKQNVLDGAVSFHYNTGAIAKASWVAKFKRGDFAGTRAALRLWRKAKGHVVKGLERRREIEADMIILAKYPAEISAPKPADNSFTNYARVVLPLSNSDIASIQSDFEKLGYAAKAGANFHRDAIEKFQRDNNLKIDGIIGKATLATLQRQVDARKKTKIGSISAFAAAAAGTGDATYSGIDQWGAVVGFGATLIAIAYCGWLAWQYRDVIASKIEPAAPRLANWIRSL